MPGVCVCFSGIFLSESRSVFLEGNGRMDRASWAGGVQQGRRSNIRPVFRSSIQKSFVAPQDCATSL